jgi:hypothetical protein
VEEGTPRFCQSIRVETMRDLVTQISLMMETAFSEESDVIEKLHQLLGELAAVGASLQDTAIQKKESVKFSSDFGGRPFR